MLAHVGMVGGGALVVAGFVKAPEGEVVDKKLAVAGALLFSAGALGLLVGQEKRSPARRRLRSF